jgi:valyl-tRNA synthetase
MPLEDRWIMSRLHRTVAEVGKLLGDFQVGEAGRRLHDFFWGEFCDWYIEMAKVRLKADDQSPLPVLAHVLDASLRLLHPFMPFVTEEVWQHLRPHLASPGAEALIVAAWPLAVEAWCDDEAESQAGLVLDIIRAIRNVRAERGVEPSRFVEAYVVVTPATHGAAEASRAVMETLARARPFHIVDGAGAAPREDVVAVVLQGAEVVLPLAGMLDVDAERARLRGQATQAEAEVQRLEAKLANDQFRSRAPQEVVAKEEGKLSAARARLEGLQARLGELG